MTAIRSPVDYYADLSGRPLESGGVYFGVAGQDPETNAIIVYWDSALTQVATQPLDITAGYIVHSGAQAQVFTARGSWSVRVRDKAGAQVAYFPTVVASEIAENFNNLQLVASAPLGNPTPTAKALLPWNFDAVSGSQREYMLQMGMTNNKLGTAGTGDKCAVYVAFASTDIGTPSDTVCDGWCMNLLYAETALAGFSNGRILELDQNIYSREYGASDASFTSGPVKFGCDALGAGYFAASAGYNVDGVPGTGYPVWNIGYGGNAFNGVKRAMFANFGTCTAFAYNRGVVTYGLDIATATKNRLAGTLGVNMNSDPIAIFQVHTGNDRNFIVTDKVGLSDGCYISAVNDANNATQGIEIAGAPIGITGILRPTVDNNYTLGASSFRWSTVYAATGAINTSDATTKRIIGPVPNAMLDAVGDVQIVIYQYLDAIAEKGEDGAREHAGITAQALRDALAAHGLEPEKCAAFCADELTEIIEEMASVTRPVMETVSVEREHVVIVDGAPVLKKETVEETHPVIDQMEVNDEAGKPVMLDIPDRPATTDPETGVTVPERKGYRGPMTHAVPRMETVEVPRKVERPKLDDDGNPVIRLGVRYTELLILMQAWTRREMARLATRVEALEAA